MPFQQVQDVLDRIRSFHRQLRDLYQASSGAQSDERVQLLLEYMARHEKNLDSVLAKYGGNAEEQIKATWLQNIPDGNVVRALEDADLKADMSPDDLIEAALEVDRALLGLYDGLSQANVAPRVRALFADLLERERIKGKQYARTVAALVRGGR